MPEVKQGTKIQIKTKVTDSATAIPQLEQGEPLFNTNDNRFYIGPQGGTAQQPDAKTTFMPMKGKDDEYTIEATDEEFSLTVESDFSLAAEGELSVESTNIDFTNLNTTTNTLKLLDNTLLEESNKYILGSDSSYFKHIHSYGYDIYDDASSGLVDLKDYIDDAISGVVNKVTIKNVLFSFEATSENVLNTLSAGVNVGDVGIIKKPIDSTITTADALTAYTGKYQYTCYVWNGTAWTATDGNYDAGNIYFSEDIPITTNFGNYKGSKTSLGNIPCKGKSLAEILDLAFGGDDETVWTTKPTASATANVTAASAEVGEEITFTYVVSLNSGTYKHGTRTETSYTLSDKTTGIQYSKVSGSYVSENLISDGATLSSETKTVVEGTNSHTFSAQTIYRSAVSKHPCSLKGNDIYDDLESEYKSEKTIDLGSKNNSCTGYRYWYASASAATQSSTCASGNKTTSSEKALGGVDSGSTISVACRSNKTPRLYTYDDFNKSWELVSGALSSGDDIFVRPENKRSANGNEVVYTTSGTDADKYKYYTYSVTSSATYKVTVS